MSGLVLDLFAGPGGWDLGARTIGLDPLGVEWDADACLTRTAYGLRTIHADVAALDPHALAAEHGPVWGLIGSPPCQAFSMAGSGAGRRDVERVERCLTALGDGQDIRAELRDEMGDAPDGALFGFATEDARSLLVVEPLRYALALRPEWIALEQVPPVLPLWEFTGEILREHGWSVWTGRLRADEYGVPQTRDRAILLASRVRQVGAPPATHQRWAKGRTPAVPQDAAGRLPWVTMAAALGWPKEDYVGFPRRNDRDDDGLYRERDLRPASEPALGLTEKARSWTRWSGGGWVLRGSAQANAAVRDANTEPAGTIASGKLALPEWHPAEDDGRTSVRITIPEAAVLQGFPADYPWHGTATAQFRQVGNAVPPPLAAHVLMEATGLGRPRAPESCERPLGMCSPSWGRAAPLAEPTRPPRRDAGRIPARPAPAPGRPRPGSPDPRPAESLPAGSRTAAPPGRGTPNPTAPSRRP